MIDQARVVIVGGGITGVNVAYHLAQLGWNDVVLLEKGELTSGSTCQAAGLVTAFNVSPTMMRFRKYSIELYNELGVFETVGSLRLASSKEQLMDLKRSVSRAKGIGLDAEIISPAEAHRLMPAISQENLYGAVYMPNDGHLDPHGATYAVANAAKALGVKIYTDVRVTGIELSPKREIKKVKTTQGDIRTEIVVNAAGIWAPQLAAMVGLWVPSTPVDHQHVMLKAVPGHELPKEMPCFRDPDYLVYGKSEAGGMVLGGYEPNPVARWVDGVPWDHSAQSLPPDMARFEQLLDGCAKRFPFVADAEIVRLICHPDALTPDANPLMGPMPGVHGFWMAAGLSLNGFGGGGGIGKTLAEWMIEGEPSMDVYAYRAWRFGKNYHDPSHAAEAARECYKYYYRLRYPFDQDEWGRPRRLSALHHRLQELGCVFGKKNGWERPDYFQPGQPWRRAGVDQREWGGWKKPAFFETVGEEHKAFRERVGLIDMTSFGKIDVQGTGALKLMQRLTDSQMNRPIGSVTYTQFLNEKGGVVADVTVTRLGKNHFRVITGASFIDSDLGWMQAHIKPGDGEVELRDMTDELVCIGMWGPQARKVLQKVTKDNVSNKAFPYMTAKYLNIKGASVLAKRVTYVGELGWELYVEPAWAVQVWDALWDAGKEFGIIAGGYKVLDSLRLEKGYRYYSADVTMLENPYEAGLGFCVHLNKGDFIGRKALRQAKKHLTQKLCTLVVGGEEYLMLYGGEAVYAGERVLGRVRSGGYGYTVKKNIVLAYLPLDLAKVGTKLEIDIFGERYPAQVVPTALFDPKGERVKA